MLEFEKKILLSEKEYCFLIKRKYSEFKTVAHTNYYYDTDDFRLNKLGITNRIREKQGVYTATVKKRRSQGTECSVEKSRIVRDRHDDAIFRDTNIAFQGILETLRSEYSPTPGITVSFDKNSYLGTMDYELEIEYESDKKIFAEAELEKIISELTKNGILSDPNEFKERVGRGKSKVARFFTRKAEIMKQTGGGNAFYSE